MFFKIISVCTFVWIISFIAPAKSIASAKIFYPTELDLAKIFNLLDNSALISSNLKCGSSCKQRPDCQGWRFISENMKCELVGNTSNGQNHKMGESETRFYLLTDTISDVANYSKTHSEETTKVASTTDVAATTDERISNHSTTVPTTKTTDVPSSITEVTSAFETTAADGIETTSEETTTSFTTPTTDVSTSTTEITSVLAPTATTSLTTPTTDVSTSTTEITSALAPTATNGLEPTSDEKITVFATATTDISKTAGEITTSLVTTATDYLETTLEQKISTTGDDTDDIDDKEEDSIMIGSLPSANDSAMTPNPTLPTGFQTDVQCEISPSNIATLTYDFQNGWDGFYHDESHATPRMERAIEKGNWVLVTDASKTDGGSTILKSESLEFIESENNCVIIKYKVTGIGIKSVSFRKFDGTEKVFFREYSFELDVWKTRAFQFKETARMFHFELIIETARNEVGKCLFDELKVYLDPCCVDDDR